MKQCCFTYRSITHAMQAVKLLQNAGISATMRRTPSVLRTHGCGYCVMLACGSLPAAQAIVQQGERQYEKLYVYSMNAWKELVE